MDVSSEPRVETLIRYVNKFILLINVLCHDMKHPNYKNCSPEKHYLPEITQLYFSLIFVKYHYIEKKKKKLLVTCFIQRRDLFRLVMASSMESVL